MSPHCFWRSTIPHHVASVFIVSGLFVWQGLRHKGVVGFLRRRAMRLGIPSSWRPGSSLPRPITQRICRPSTTPGSVDSSVNGFPWAPGPRARHGFYAGAPRVRRIGGPVVRRPPHVRMRYLPGPSLRVKSPLRLFLLLAVPSALTYIPWRLHSPLSLGHVRSLRVSEPTRSPLPDVLSRRRGPGGAGVKGRPPWPPRVELTSCWRRSTVLALTAFAALVVIPWRPQPHRSGRWLGWAPRMRSSSWRARRCGYVSFTGGTLRQRSGRRGR